MSEKTDEDAVEEEFKDDSEYGFKPDASQEKRGLWRKGLTKEGSQLGFTSQHKTLNVRIKLFRGLCRSSKTIKRRRVVKR